MLKIKLGKKKLDNFGYQVEDHKGNVLKKKGKSIRKVLDKHSSRVELTHMLPKPKKKLSFKDIVRDEDATMNWNRDGKKNVE